MLAVDDDPVCLRTLTMLASNTKTLSVIACDGAESALRELRSGDFDLILSDILMPGMNGFDFVAEVRKLTKYRTTPVVFLTSLSDFETRSKSVLNGGCDLIAKPFTAGEVVVKALTLGLKRRFESAASPIQTSRQPQEPKPNGASEHPEVHPQNNGANGHGTLNSGRLKLQASGACGVIGVGEDGAIRSMNIAAAELMGYSPGESVEGGIQALIPDELQSEDNKTLLSRVIAGKVKNQSRIEMTGRCKDNSTIRLWLPLAKRGCKARARSCAYPGGLPDYRCDGRRVRARGWHDPRARRRLKARAGGRCKPFPGSRDKPHASS